MSRLTKLVVGTFLALLIVPVVFRVGLRIYIAAYMRSSGRRVANKAIPLPNGGNVWVHGAEYLLNLRDHPRYFVWDASYQPPGSAGREYIGSWMAYANGTTAYVRGPLVVVIPNTDYYRVGLQQLFACTESGKWKEIHLDFTDIADGIDPPTLTSYKTSLGEDDLRKIKAALGPAQRELGPRCWINGFSPDRGELRVAYTTTRGGGELLLGLSSEGEKFQLLEIRKH